MRGDLWKVLERVLTWTAVLLFVALVAVSYCHAELVSAAPNPDAIGPATWRYGTCDGQSGWFVVRADSQGRVWVYAGDQPSGRKVPCYLHRPASSTAPLNLSAPSVLGYAVGDWRTTGVTVGQIGHTPGGEILTNAPKVAADLIGGDDDPWPPHTHDGQPCPGPGPCPNPDRPRKPDPAPEPVGPDDEQPDQLAAIRPYVVPVSLAVGLLAAVLAALKRRNAAG